MYSVHHDAGILNPRDFSLVKTFPRLNVLSYCKKIFFLIILWRYSHIVGSVTMLHKLSRDYLISIIIIIWGEEEKKIQRERKRETLFHDKFSSYRIVSRNLYTNFIVG